MSNKSWGPIIWVFLHTLVAKIKNTEFKNNKEKLIEIIFKVCSNLPCPDCSEDSVKFLRTVNFKNATKKEDLIEILFVFHNQVNINLKKTEFPEKLLETYNNNNINIVLKRFIETFNKNTNNIRLMNQSFMRSIISKDIKNYIENNIHYFEDL
tara:strand:+ start:58 stop:516 length:459 start_codon:yes stop_codon:yes gene_type:complete